MRNMEPPGTTWTDQADPKPTHQTDKSRPTNFTQEFKHGGRSYQVYKRFQTRDGSYYVKFEHRQALYKKSLQTNVATVAIERAKRFIDSVFNSDWETLEKLSPKLVNVSLAKLFTAYEQIAVIDPKSIHNNELALLLMVRRVHGIDDPAKATLKLIDASLAHRFQEVMAKEAGDDREAREKALRSSRSLIQQARSLFSRKKELPEKYKAHGIILPTNIDGFMTCRLEGSLLKSDYHAPPDEIVKAAFDEIEKVKDHDPIVYVAFWLAVGAGLRRKEIQQVRWDHLVERDGVTWVSGGIGKNGRMIDVPMQSKAVAALAPFRKPSGPILWQRGLEWSKRINWWMGFHGWNTEKKIHELRAYIGSLLYRVNPHLARHFMRHRSIKQTEEAYCRYGPGLKPVDVL